MRYATKHSIDRGFHIAIHNDISAAKKAAEGSQIVNVPVEIQSDSAAIMALFDDDPESDIP